MDGRERVAAGLFLLGAALFALIGWWLPGVVGLIALVVWVDGRYRREAWALGGAALVWALYEWTMGLPRFVFVGLMVGAALLILWRGDFSGE